MDNYFKDCPPKMDDGRYLTDFRPTSIREQFIKSINGIVRDDEYRNFLQKNGESIIDREWSALRKTQSCHTNECVHIYQTRTTTVANLEEMRIYDALRTGQLTRSDPHYPYCTAKPDYRLTHTKDVKYI